MAKYLSKFISVSFSFVLIACGGGGGGGGDTVTPTAVLAEEDPLQITQEIVGATSFADAFVLGFVLGLSDVAAASADAAEQPVVKATDVIASLAAGKLEKLRSSGSPADDVFSVSPSVIRPCDESGSVNIIETDTRSELDFMDCEGGYAREGIDFPGTVNGKLIIEITDVDDSGSVVGAGFRFRLVNFSTVEDEEALLLDGNYRGSVAIQLNGDYIDVGLFTSSFFIQLNDDVSELTNYEFDARVTDSFERQDTSGGLEGFGFAGVVYFYTPTPLRFTYSADQFTSGVIVIECADNAAITITANGTEFPDVDIDYDGDGIIDEQPTWSWEEIFALEADF